MRKVLILAPRLDCSFKQGHVPTVEGPPNHPLRKFYQPFYENLVAQHLSMGDQVSFDKKALWQFDPSDYKDSEFDIIYVPHKQKYQFDLGDKGRYYMQQVIPSIFSIDSEGWGADISVKPKPTEDRGAFNLLNRRIASNTSKFAQPAYDPNFTEKNYIFFPCQLPHDETIKYHSTVSPYEALRITLDWARYKGLKVFVKGHPANPMSMDGLRDLTARFENAYWTESMSIHQLIENCRFVSLVNSGVGIEALLHKKKVAAFGRSDYTRNVSGVIPVRTFIDLDEADDVIFFDKVFPEFIQGWYDHYYDVENPESFSKLV